MEKTIEQVEKNTQASFAYVKKDLLMLNDAISDIHDKIQHLSLNHATLLEEIEKIRKVSGIKIKSKAMQKAKKSVSKPE